MIRRARRLARQVTGRDVRASVQLRAPCDRFGSDYGGWPLLRGSVGPEDVVYSFGVGEDISFDLAVVERLGARVWAFDPTPRSIAWVQRQCTPERWHFQPVGIADYDGTAEFVAPKDASHVSYSSVRTATPDASAVRGEVRRLSTIMASLGHERLDVLKMDVEGAEYAVIDDLVRSGIQVRQLLVEFHHFFPGIPASATERAIRTLGDAGFRIFDISPGGYEYGFVRTEVS